MQQPQETVDLGIEGITDAVRIGAGGYGTVYRARQEAFDRTVAVKVLRAPAFDEDVRRRFDRECRALGSLSGHPHIVAVHASGVAASGLCYLVMEYLSGGTLAQRLAVGGPLPAGEVAGIGVKLAGALAAAHTAGVLHRDLKPENVLVSAYGEPQLVDFGVAHVEGVSATQSGSITGTLAHAAPEVLSGEGGQEAADVYSLASTLYALLAGQAPFVRAGEVAFFPLMARVLTEPPPDLRPRGVPAPLWQILEQALVKDPARRTATAGALAEALRTDLRTSETGPISLIAPVAVVPEVPGDSGPDPDDPGTVSVRGAWAKPGIPAPPQPLLPRAPRTPTFVERVRSKGFASTGFASTGFGSKATLRLVAGAVGLVVVAVAAVVVMSQPSAQVTDVASGEVGATTTTVPRDSVTSAVPTTEPEALAASPTTVASVAPPVPQTTMPSSPGPRRRPGGDQPAPATVPSAPVTRSESPTPPLAVRPPVAVDYPVCTSGDFQVANKADRSERRVMRQRTCTEELSDGSVKASMLVHDLERTVDDRIAAVYRVELRRCDTGAVLSSDPEGTGSRTVTGQSPVFLADTGSFRPPLYAVAEIGDLELTTRGSGGDVIWSGDGLAQTTDEVCP